MRSASVRVRDPAGTKRAVLDSAERLFAARGFAGTSIRDIAEASGVSHPLIQHHFGTKEALYEAVLNQCGTDYESRYPDLARADRGIDWRAEMARIFEFLRDREALLRMVGWARLEGKVDLLARCDGPRGWMVRRIEAGQRLGTVRTDIEAASLGVMLEGLLIYWFENRAYNARLYPTPLDDATYLDQAAALMTRGAAPAPPGPGIDSAIGH